MSERFADPTGVFARAKRVVESIKSPQGQIREVARILHSHRYAKSHEPLMQETWLAVKAGERPSKMMFYIWLDTPFGDDLILATGPSFEPKLALASQIPKEPGVGIYVNSLVASLKGTVVDGLKRAEQRHSKLGQQDMVGDRRSPPRPAPTASRPSTPKPTPSAPAGGGVARTVAKVEAAAKTVAKVEAVAKKAEKQAPAAAKPAIRVVKKAAEVAAVKVEKAVEAAEKAAVAEQKAEAAAVKAEAAVEKIVEKVESSESDDAGAAAKFLADLAAALGA